MGKKIYTEGEIIGDYKISFIEEVAPTKLNKRMAIFKCHCGKKWKAAIAAIKVNTIKSCGCNRITHGLTKDPLYKTYTMMMHRVYNPKSVKYPLYKNRLVEPYLQEVKNYVEYVGNLPNAYKKGLTVDRIDNNLGYIRGNLRWADIYTQQGNTTKNNKYVGVYFEKRIKKYVSRIKLNRKSYFIGVFKKLEQAIFARNRFIVENDFPHPIQQIKTN